MHLGFSLHLCLSLVFAFPRHRCILPPFASVTGVSPLLPRPLGRCWCPPFPLRNWPARVLLSLLPHASHAPPPLPASSRGLRRARQLPFPVPCPAGGRGSRGTSPMPSGSAWHEPALCKHRLEAASWSWPVGTRHTGQCRVTFLAPKVNTGNQPTQPFCWPTVGVCCVLKN